jgi:hypothetical protein
VVGLVDLEIAFCTAGVTPLEAGDIQPRIACRTKWRFLSDRDLHVVFLKRLIGINTRIFSLRRLWNRIPFWGEPKETR